jgi:hypothetical protein
MGGLWRQVDYATKISIPWQEVHDESVPLEKALLLDYVSPMFPVSFYRAIKNRHYSVVLSMMGYLLIMITVCSIPLLSFRRSKG